MQPKESSTWNILQYSIVTRASTIVLGLQDVVAAGLETRGLADVSVVVHQAARLGAVALQLAAAGEADEHTDAGLDLLKSAFLSYAGSSTALPELTKARDPEGLHVLQPTHHLLLKEGAALGVTDGC